MFGHREMITELKTHQIYSIKASDRRIKLETFRNNTQIPFSFSWQALSFSKYKT